MIPKIVKFLFVVSAILVVLMSIVFIGMEYLERHPIPFENPIQEDKVKDPGCNDDLTVTSDYIGVMIEKYGPVPGSGGGTLRCRNRYVSKERAAEVELELAEYRAKREAGEAPYMVWHSVVFNKKTGEIHTSLYTTEQPSRLTMCEGYYDRSSLFGSGVREDMACKIFSPGTYEDVITDAELIEQFLDQPRPPTLTSETCVPNLPFEQLENMTAKELMDLCGWEE